MFYQRHLRGETYQEIADGSAVSKGCVRYWCRRQRDGGDCRSRYHRSSPGTLSSFAPIIRYVILRLKKKHPRWGRERIHYHLSKRPSCRGLRLPNPSSIGRYLQQFVKFRRGKAKVTPRVRPRPVTEEHERWQLDFRRNLEGANEQKLTLHTIMDEYSGACITAQLVPKEMKAKQSGRVTWREAQNTLRFGFAAWGTLPESVQTDNESTLVGRSGTDFPTDFTLWLVGLGIDHTVIRPGVSTDNSEVERGHRTITDYAIIGQEQQPVAELQLKVTAAAQELAFVLPSRAKACKGRPPVEAYPQLLAGARPYQLEQELALFQMQRVYLYLAQFQWQRKVSVNGTIQLGNASRRYSLGRQYAGEEVRIYFDAKDCHLVFFGLIIQKWKSVDIPLKTCLSGGSSAWMTQMFPWHRSNCLCSLSSSRGKLLMSRKG
jgi:transposase InsO family protein